MSNGLRAYGKGWRAAWKGGWGPLRDGNSKLGRLARRIEREYLAELPTLNPPQRRRLRMAAKFLALATMTLDQVGVDPKCTRRAAAGLNDRGDRIIARLRAETAGSANGAARPPSALEAYLEARYGSRNAG
jgi:hypothetical protein